jgi:hypothetical protein
LFLITLIIRCAIVKVQKLYDIIVKKSTSAPNIRRPDDGLLITRKDIITALNANAVIIKNAINKNQMLFLSFLNITM